MYPGSPFADFCVTNPTVGRFILIAWYGKMPEGSNLLEGQGVGVG